MSYQFLLRAAALGVILATGSAPALAADAKIMFPLAGAFAANDAHGRLGDSVRFYFAGQETPAVAQKIDTDKTSLRTNAFGKASETACNWVFLSAMLQLQKHAVAVGADAVVNIVSNYNNVEMASATEFECHVGAIMAGVALKGDFVKLAK